MSITEKGSYKILPSVFDLDRKHCKYTLKSLDHLVVMNIFPTETVAMADVVFPASAFAETDDVYTDTERRVQRLRQAVTPSGEAKTELVDYL